MDLTLAYHPLLLAVAGLAALGLTVWTYKRSNPQLAGWKKWVVHTLRFSALFIVILLLFEPVLRTLDRNEEDPLLAVLVDETQSITGDQESIRDSTAAEHIQQLIQGLAGDGLEHFAFSDDIRALETTSDSLLRFEGERTDIATALQSTVNTLARRNARGILLISDGRYNTGRNPLYLAERSLLPIYTVVVGDTTQQRDVILSQVVTNDIAYTNTTLPVRAHIRAHNFANERVTVSLLQDGRTVSSESTALPENSLETTVELSVTPASPGLHRYTVAVSRLSGEATYRNNVQTVTVRVLDAERQVLVISAAPGPDVSALTHALERNTDIELDTYTQRSQGVFYEGRLPDDLSRYDLAILVGYPGTTSSESNTLAVAQAIRAGLPAIFFLSQQTDLNRLQSSFADVLPAVPDVVRSSFLEGSVVVSPAGSTHPILDVSGERSNVFQGLPPLMINESRWGVTPGSRTLATIRRGNVALNDPLIVTRSLGNNRSAAVLGAGTWRWANLPEDLSDSDDVYNRLLENLILWTTTRADRRQVRVRPTHTQFGETEPVTFTGQVYDESLEPVDNASIRLAITSPDGSQLPVSMSPLGNGRYQATAGILSPGNYTFTAAAEVGGSEIGSDGGSFNVGELALEFRDPGADADLMRELALRSGGRVVHENELPQLLDILRDEGRFSGNPVEREESNPLIDFPFLLALAIGFLATEWFIRKRNGLV